MPLKKIDIVNFLKKRIFGKKIPKNYLSMSIEKVSSMDSLKIFKLIIEIESNRTFDIINRSIQISRETNRTVNSLIMLYQINNNSQDFKQHHELQKKINNQIKSKYIIVINPDNNYDIGNKI